MRLEPKLEISSFSLEDIILEILQDSSYPILETDLLEKIREYVPRATNTNMESSLEILRKKGYDIKEISHGTSKLYTLVRFFEISSEELYRITGTLELPAIITSDFHFGSKNCYRKAFDLMLEDVHKYNIKSMTIAGDLLQGVGVFRGESQELEIPEIGAQIDGLADILKNFKDISFHIVLGNHEEPVKSIAGLDPLKVLSSMLDDCYYYGHVGMLKIKDLYKYMMFHGQAISRTTSYPIEKIWDGLLEKPNILHTAHTHQKCIIQFEWNKWGILSGTLQRTNSYLLQKGLNAKEGWYILKDISDKGLDIIDRTLRVS